MSARDFQSARNKMLSAIAQTFRHQNLIVLFNSPNQSFVDVNLRRLIHGTLEISHHDEKYTHGRFMFNITDHLTGQIHARPLLFKDRDRNQSFYLRRIKINKPSRKVTDAYETLGREFKLSVADTARKKVLSTQAPSLPETEDSETIPLTARELNDGFNDPLIPAQLGKVKAFCRKCNKQILGRKCPTCSSLEI